MNISEKITSVFIIDDNEVDLFIEERVVASLKIAEKIDCFSSPLRAFERLKKMLNEEEPLPSLIFLDVNMPGMNGFQFLDALQPLMAKKKQRVKVFIVSSSDSLRDKEMAKNYPEVVEYVVKPLTDDWLSSFFIYKYE